MKKSKSSSAVKVGGRAIPILRFKSQGSWASGTTLFDEIDFVRRSRRAIFYTRPGR